MLSASAQPQREPTWLDVREGCSFSAMRFVWDQIHLSSRDLAQNAQSAVALPGEPPSVLMKVPAPWLESVVMTRSRILDLGF